MRAFTVRPDDAGAIVVLPGIELVDGELPLPQIQPTPELLAVRGRNGLIERSTPYRRLDPTVDTVDLGPETLPDVRALVLLDGRAATSGVYFSFVYTSDVGAGVTRLAYVNTRGEGNGPAQMSELVVLQPGAGVPILLGRRGAHAVVRYDGRGLLVELVPTTTTHAARPADVLVPV